MDRATELIRRALPIADRPQRAWLLFIRGVIEGQSGWLLDGVATMRQGVALSEDPSVTLQLLREGFAMAGQAGAVEEAADFASRAADVTPGGEIDSFTKASLIASAAELSGDHERARSLSAELVELANGIDDPGVPDLGLARRRPRRDAPGGAPPRQSGGELRARAGRDDHAPVLPPGAGGRAHR